MQEAARAEGVNAERVSRLASRALGACESVVERLTRKGRPPASEDSEDSEENELALTRVLLGVATSILQHVKLRKDAIRCVIVGSYLHLRETHPQLTQKRFCQTLAVPERTLRSWLKNKPSDDCRPHSEGAGETGDFQRVNEFRPFSFNTINTIDTNKATRRKRKRPARRGRFDFAVTIPDTQIAGDTTDLRAFGVPLKLVATQDVGGRDQSLLDAIIVDDRESADHVVAVLRQSLADRPGAQFLSDQGTPYLAARTREALDTLQVEHAVQKEGDPLGKATIERAFGTVKRIASPLLALTDRVTDALPALSQPDLAIAVTTLLLAALLRAYQAGARATRRACAERPTDVDQLARVAEESRERARADDRSARLLLTHIHGAYDIGGLLRDFIRRFRGIPVSVIRAAERTFARQAHRSDIRNRAAYFARLIRVAQDHYHRQRALKERQRRQSERLAHHQRRVRAEQAAWSAEPVTWLHDVLTLIAARWDGQTLLFDGAGLVTWLRQSLTRLADFYGPLSAQVVASVFCAFEQARLPDIGPAGVAAVKAVLERHSGVLPKSSDTPFCASYFAAILLGTGANPRPPPSPDSC
ncbi:MAG: transposase family protein [bacterium]|nr:transposase family protein [bacterium]